MKSVSHKSGLLSSFPAWFPGKLLSAGREQHAPYALPKAIRDHAQVSSSSLAKGTQPTGTWTAS